MSHCCVNLKVKLKNKMTHRVRGFQPSPRSEGKWPRAQDGCERYRGIRGRLASRADGGSSRGTPGGEAGRRAPSFLCSGRRPPPPALSARAHDSLHTLSPYETSRGPSHLRCFLSPFSPPRGSFSGGAGPTRAASAGRHEQRPVTRTCSPGPRDGGAERSIYKEVGEVGALGEGQRLAVATRI